MFIDLIVNNSTIINTSMSGILTMIYIFGFIKSKGFPIAQTILYGSALLFFSAETLGKVFNWKCITDFKLFDMGLPFFITLLICEVFIVMHVVFFYVSREESRGNKLYQMVPSSIASGIYAYFDRESEVLMYTEHFYNKIKMNDESAKKWYKNVIKFTVDDQDFKYYGFLKYLAGFDEKDFNIVIEFNDFRKEEFVVQKTKIVDNKKIVGYILVDKKPTAAEVYQIGANKEFKLQLFHYFDSLNEAVGYYDNDFGGYRLTALMANKLGISELLITLDELKEFIHENDRANFDKEFKQEKGTLNYRYRLKTVTGLEWHEEVRTVEDGIVYSVFRKLELVPNKVVMNTKADMLANINSMYSEEKGFGLLSISINKIIDIIDEFGLDFANMVLDNYFGYLNEEIFEMNLKLYRMSNYEFAIIIDDLSKYEEFIRNIAAGVSPILKYDLYYGSTKYRLDNFIGLVSSNDVISKTGEDLFQAANEALELALDEKCAKNFSIYVSKTVNDVNYKFEDHVVDIDNKFLDE